MIQKMEAYSSQPDAPELPLGGFMPNDDPIHVKNIDGLGPVTANITTTPYATSRGELYQDSSIGKRNIVLTLGYNPNWGGQQTIGSLRQILYRYFSPKQWCKLRFFSDDLPVVDIEGYCESFDPSIFSQDPEVQISIICPNPDFVEADASLITGIVDDGTTETVFNYIGSTDTGFELRVDATLENPGYTGEFDIGMKAFGLPQSFQVGSAMVDGLTFFKLSTVDGAKRVSNVAKADGAIINLLDQMMEGSVWGKIQPGQNVLTVKATEAGQKWTLAYFNRFVGL